MTALSGKRRRHRYSGQKRTPLFPAIFLLIGWMHGSLHGWMNASMYEDMDPEIEFLHLYKNLMSLFAISKW